MRPRDAAIGLLLILLTAAAYAALPGNDFISFDDPEYLTRNQRVSQGLTPQNAVWALTSFENANWHPLTWISHMADVSLFGMRPGRHHVVNLLLHLMNTVLVFGVFTAATSAFRPSLLVAALFAVHPLHVESVAWASERKDVLCAFFYLLAAAAYLRYARRPGTGRYLAVLVPAALGLMAKPMAVSLPFALLIFDFWPLGRFLPSRARRESGSPAPGRTPLTRLLLEKAPLLALAVGAGVATIIAQSREAMSLSYGVWSAMKVTLPNVPLAYAHYLNKLTWPSDLTIFYPHRAHGIDPREVVLPLLLLLGVSIVAIRTWSRRPWLAAGWSWYLVVLMPTVGILQVGSQAVADRYTYLPLLGIFVLLCWGIPDALPRFPGRAALLGAGAAAIVLLLALQTARQVRFWRDDTTLFTRALVISPGNYLAHYFLGQGFLERGDSVSALGHYEVVLKERPLEFRTLFASGMALYGLGRHDEALERFQTYLTLRPESYEARYNIAAILSRQGRPKEAIPYLEQVLRLRPGLPKAATLLEQCRRQLSAWSAAGSKGTLGGTEAVGQTTPP